MLSELRLEEEEEGFDAVKYRLEKWAESAVRLEEFFFSERARGSHCPLLGSPLHRFAHCDWAQTEVRQANDGHGYTFPEYEKEYGRYAAK